jgi:hypothetical protein
MPDMEVNMVTLQGEFSQLSGLSYGNHEEYTASPVLLPREESGMKVLGRSGQGEPVLVMKDFEDYRVIFCAMPRIHHSLLREIARNAGVHLYSESGDCIFATKDVLAVSVNQGGVKKITLPEKRKIIDAFDQSIVSPGAETFSIDFAEKGSRLFFLEDIRAGAQ